MKHLLSGALVAVAACSSTERGGTSETTMSSPPAEMGSSAFRPLASLRLNWHDGGPTRGALLPVPLRRGGQLTIAALQIPLPTSYPGISAEERSRNHNQVVVPRKVAYLDPRTGALMDSSGPEDANDWAGPHFGIPGSPNRVLGRLDDPNWLPKDRIEVLRLRICSALDTLLPFFADEGRPWTEEANKAAQEVRDFFPLAAEPGLWPYYKAEGREFFAWVEKNAPPARVRLPWDPPGQ